MELSLQIEAQTVAAVYERVNELESSAFLLASPPRLRFADRPTAWGSRL